MATASMKNENKFVSTPTTPPWTFFNASQQNSKTKYGSCVCVRVLRNCGTRCRNPCHVYHITMFVFVTNNVDSITILCHHVNGTLSGEYRIRPLFLDII